MRYRHHPGERVGETPAGARLLPLDPAWLAALRTGACDAVAAVTADLLVLEHQFDESSLFVNLCPGPVPTTEDEFLPLPTRSGIGFALN